VRQVVKVRAVLKTAPTSSVAQVRRFWGANVQTFGPVKASGKWKGKSGKIFTAKTRRAQRKAIEHRDTEDTEKAFTAKTQRGEK
jgi:predicted phosphatase